MADEPFDVEIDDYEGIDIIGTTSRELFKGAVRAQRLWRENLRSAGWKNTGEAINDVTVEPKQPGELEYVTGGDVIQLLIAEEGRAPDSAPPPFDAIARWAREKGLQPEEGQTFEEMVEAIRWSIAKNGIEAFHPARDAAREVEMDLPDNVRQALIEEIEQQEADSL